MQKIKYINNKDLLAEIKVCKASFCRFAADEYANYDVIVASVDCITTELLEETIRLKAARLSTKALPVEPAEVNASSVVFRVMTDSHLPPPDDKNRRRKLQSGDLTKTNFNPFRHFVLQDGVLTEVGRSHWLGDFDDGTFSIEHGKISNRLALMFMLLVEQYSRRGNWRGYCLDASGEALTHRGWLNMDEITEEDIILSYREGKLEWSKIKSIYRGDYDGKMFQLTVAGMDALVTPGHRFITANGPKEVELLTEKDRLILMGDAEDGGPQTYSDGFVELVGWAVTEGCYRKNRASIAVSQNEGPKAERIRACLRQLEARYSEYHARQYTGNVNVRFTLTKKISQEIMAVAAGRVLSMPFILALTQTQRELLINTMVDGDGCRTSPYGDVYKGGYMRYAQKDKNHLDAFLALCTLNGYRTTTTCRNVVANALVRNPTSIYEVNIFSKTYDRHRHSMVENINFHGGKRNGRAHPGRGKHAHPNEPTVEYKGKVWCPEVENGTFMARRKGTIWLSQNSYLDEMRSHALVQLAQVGLQFDESRSDNPFAFYTQIIKNCLAADVLLLTREFGAVPIGTLSGQDVHLFDGDRNWVKSHIYDYGIQITAELKFHHQDEIVSVRSTLDHGWVEHGTGERVETRQVLEGGDYVIADLRPDGRRSDGWQVSSEAGRRAERVFCPDVPTTHSMALGTGIHSFQCFRRILNLERRVQSVRDDLLIMAGAMPSFNRQVDSEIDQRDGFDPLSDKPGRRGRKPKGS